MVALATQVTALRTRLEEEMLDRERGDAERIQRAVERGGYPNDAEANEIYRAWGHVFDLIENVVWRVEGLSRSFNGSDLPPITFEHYAAVASIVDTARMRCEEISAFASTLTEELSVIDTLRHEQVARSVGGEPHDGA